MGRSGTAIPHIFTMISVCIATYNGSKYIKEQLQSILKQLGEEDEIIISDDGSTDDTVNIIRGVSDNRIRVVNHTKDASYKNLSVASFLFASYNFENAIMHARGNIIYLSDQDDVWAPDRIEKTLPLMGNNDLVMCNFSLIDENSTMVLEKYLSKDPAGKTLFWNLWKIPFRGCCMTIKREVLLQSMPLPSQCVCHDIWIGTYLVHKGYKYTFINEPLHYYRSHTTNVSPVVGKSPNSLWFKLAYRLRYLIQVFTHKSLVQ